MDEKKYVLTIEFPNETQRKCFMRMVEEYWKDWIEYKIIENKEEYLKNTESVIKQLKKILKEYNV